MKLVSLEGQASQFLDGSGHCVSNNGKGIKHREDVRFGEPEEDQSGQSYEGADRYPDDVDIANEPMGTIVLRVVWCDGPGNHELGQRNPKREKVPRETFKIRNRICWKDLVKKVRNVVPGKHHREDGNGVRDISQPPVCSSEVAAGT